MELRTAPIRISYAILQNPITLVRSIRCNQCWSVSHHPEDVRQRYCARCGIFHDDKSQQQPTE